MLSLEEAAEFAPEQVVGLSQELAAAQQQVDVFKHQLEWYKRQLFGHKSERRIIEGAGAQLNLGELIDPGPGQAPQQKRLVSAHTRSIATNRPEAGDECVPFFDETKLINRLTLDAHCPFSKEPDYKKCAVRIERA